MVAGHRQAHRRREAAEVPVALIDAEGSLHEPVAALPAEGRERCVANLPRDIDRQLRPKAPADLLQEAYAGLFSPECLTGIPGPVPLDAAIGKAEHGLADRAIGR